jgi:hypothetical protein
MRALLIGIGLLGASCVGEIATQSAARPGSGRTDICRDHRGINATDVHGNEMYVRCNDGTIFTR